MASGETERTGGGLRRRGGRAARRPEPSVDPSGDAGSEDGRLRDVGLGAVSRRRSGVDTLILGCGAVAREIIASLKSVGAADRVDLACLPAKLHNAPERIAPGVSEALVAARAAGYARVLVAYADCGTGGALDRALDAAPAGLAVERMAGPHCYSFFSGEADFASRADEEIGAFYLTDFLARQFEPLVWRGLGLDRAPELRDAYFGHYDRLVYLAQTDDPALDAAARAAAEQLGLRFERRFTGNGELATFVSKAAALASDPGVTHS